MTIKPLFGHLQCWSLTTSWAWKFHAETAQLENSFLPYTCVLGIANSQDYSLPLNGAGSVHILSSMTIQMTEAISMSPFSPGCIASGTSNATDVAFISHCPDHHSLYHLLLVRSSEAIVLPLPNKVITALFWTLHNSSNATWDNISFPSRHITLWAYIPSGPIGNWSPRLTPLPFQGSVQ